jgi:APA family basic amino acid/polyamine antiporter
MLVSGSRILYGISNDKSLPSIFSRIHSKRKTPWAAVMVIGFLSVLFTLAGDLSTVANISVFGIIMVFILVNFSLIWLRFKQPDAERQFKVPLSVKKLPVLPVLGIITPVFGVVQFEPYIIMMGTGVVVLGVLFYFAYNKLTKERDRF